MYALTRAMNQAATSAMNVNWKKWSNVVPRVTSIASSLACSASQIAQRIGKTAGWTQTTPRITVIGTDCENGWFNVNKVLVSQPML